MTSRRAPVCVSITASLTTVRLELSATLWRHYSRGSGPFLPSAEGTERVVIQTIYLIYICGMLACKTMGSEEPQLPRNTSPTFQRSQSSSVKSASSRRSWFLRVHYHRLNRSRTMSPPRSCAFALCASGVAADKERTKTTSAVTKHLRCCLIRSIGS